MRSTHQAVVSAAVDEVWDRLRSDRLLSALSGAKLERHEDAVTGSVAVRFGSTQVTYRLRATSVWHPDRPHAASVDVTGKEARGDGTLTGSLDVVLTGDGGTTSLSVTAELTATGRAESVRPATWSRSLDRLLTGVADALGDAAPKPSAVAPTQRTAASAKESQVAAPEEPPTGAPVSPSPPVEPAGPARTPIGVAALPPPAGQRSTLTTTKIAGALVVVAVFAMLLRRSRRRSRR